jgi:hypothetical protein
MKPSRVRPAGELHDRGHESLGRRSRLEAVVQLRRLGSLGRPSRTEPFVVDVVRGSWRSCSGRTPWSSGAADELSSSSAARRRSRRPGRTTRMAAMPLAAQRCQAYRRCRFRRGGSHRRRPGGGSGGSRGRRGPCGAWGGQAVASDCAGRPPAVTGAAGIVSLGRDRSEVCMPIAHDGEGTARAKGRLGLRRVVRTAATPGRTAPPLAVGADHGRRARDPPTNP